MRSFIYIAGEKSVGSSLIAKQIRISVSLLAILLLSNRLAPAAVPPPPNDLCSGAIVVPNTFPYVTPLVNISSATTNDDPTSPEACVYQGQGISRSVWYSFTPAVTGFYTFSVSSNDTRTSVQDTVMAIYSAPGCSGPFTLLDCNQDVGDDLRSALGIDLSAGQPYYIVVWAFYWLSPSLSGTNVEMRVNKPLPPANDNCVTAEEIPAQLPLPYKTATNDIILATTVGDPAVPAACATDVSKSIWYHFAPANSGSYIFSTRAEATATTVYDTVMALYSSTGGCAGPFTPVACNDDASASVYRSVIITNLTANTHYYVVIWELGLLPSLPTESKVQLLVADARPQIISCEIPQDGYCTIRFLGVPGQTYRILASDNLATWTDVGGAVRVTGNQFAFTHVTDSAPRFFYQVKMQ